MIDADDFAAWQDNPITQRYFAALSRKRDEAKARWLAATWDGGSHVDAVLHADCWATADTCRYAVEMSYEEMQEVLDDQPQRDQPDRVQGTDQA